MMGSEWGENLSVGNEMIDADHQKLIALAQGIERMIKNKDVAALPQAFARLEQALRDHFVVEEMLARAIKIPFFNNKLEHECVLEAFFIMKESIVDEKGAIDEEAEPYYAEFLSGWMIGHILDEDMLMKPVLQTYPYDFRPGLTQNSRSDSLTSSP